MNANEFRDVSIRGRVAFSILCLENAIEHFHVELLPWDFVLEKLWEFTSSTGYLDDWSGYMSEIMPDNILSEPKYPSMKFEDMGFQYISKQYFNTLRDVYLQAGATLCCIIDKIFFLATGEMYGALHDGAPYNLEHLQEIIDMMEQHTIPLPSIEVLKSYSFQEEGGWGRHFDRSELFRT